MINKAIVSIIFYTLSTSFLIGQEFQNLDFSNKCKSLKQGTCAWTKSFGKEDCCIINANGYLQIESQTENAVGFVEQEIIKPLEALVIMELEARVKTVNVAGKGAGLNVSVYNEANQLITYKDMGGFYSNRWITNTTNWQKTKIALVLPTETHKIRIGGILYGKGQSFFDDFKVSFSYLDDRKYNQKAIAYISNAVEHIQNNSLFKDSVDFDYLKTTALKIAGEITDYTECYLAIEFLLESLRPHGDNHSFFMTAEERIIWENGDTGSEKIEYAEVSNMDGIGYILVPPFHSGNEQQMVKYAQHIHTKITNLTSEIEGWIVDLRQNTGGNQEPMITGLAPLLDKGNIGALIDVNGTKEHWYYRDGTYYWEDEKGITLQNPAKLDRKLPIVVLTGPQTGSSGEIVVISFIGNTNTISMGKPTMGLTTGNGEFKLLDGSYMYLASTKMVDRTGKIYNAAIEPDVLIDAKSMKGD